jgi:FkbM family methyltransferase
MNALGSSGLDGIIRPLRSIIQALQTRRERISAAEKLARAIALVPVFGVLLGILRLASAAGARFLVEGRTCDGLRFQCHPPDLVQMYIWLFDVWEPDLTDIVRRRLGSGDGFIDVGANIGYFSCLASRIVGDHGCVIAVEASPPIFSQLEETVRLNECRGIRLLNKAASDAHGAQEVFAGPAHNIGLTTTIKSRGFRKQATVEAMPLDAMVTSDELSTIALVKIDVEGGEVSVLAGMDHIVRHGPDRLEILVELSPLWWNRTSMTPREVLQPLIAAGFNVYLIENNYWPWRYLWPNCVRRPQRLRDLSVLNQRRKRFDLLLSRRDADAL